MRYMMFIKHTEDYRNKTVPAGLHEAIGWSARIQWRRGLIDLVRWLKTGRSPTSLPRSAVA